MGFKVSSDKEMMEVGRMAEGTVMSDRLLTRMTCFAGRLYDKFGTAANWWSSETEEQFNNKADCFVKQYGSFTVVEINSTVSIYEFCSKNKVNFQIIILRAMYIRFSIFLFCCVGIHVHNIC